MDTKLEGLELVVLGEDQEDPCWFSMETKRALLNVIVDQVINSTKRIKEAATTRELTPVEMAAAAERLVEILFKMEEVFIPSSEDTFSGFPFEL
jgi:hypothetical protein